MKARLFFLFLIFSIIVNPSFAKKINNSNKFSKNKDYKKINPDDAKEFCLIKLGASTDDSSLNKCILKIQKTGKLDGVKLAPLKY